MFDKLRRKLIKMHTIRSVNKILRDMDIRELLEDSDIAEPLDNLVPEARDEHGNWHVEERK